MIILYQLNIDGVSKLLKDSIVPSNHHIVLLADMAVMKVVFTILYFG